MTIGRKTKLTPAVQDRIVSAIRAGSYAVVAAEYGGIDTKTFYNWINRGEAYSPEESEPHEEIFFHFFQSVKNAEAEAELFHIQNIRKSASSGNWQASAWWLERKFSDRWARKEKREITGKDGGPVEQTVFYIPENGRDDESNAKD